MEWPSERVRPGGLFQPAKITYSPETKNYLKVLLDESKLTMMQRQKVNYSLRSGEPLPPLSKQNRNTGSKKQKFRPGPSRKRSQSTIIDSGAYEREKFVPSFPKVDREAAKKHLQDFMAYGKVLASSPRRTKPKPIILDDLDENRFDQLVREIEDRKAWLEEMEELGEGEKYKTIIELQIQQKLRELNNLKIQQDTPQSTER